MSRIGGSIFGNADCDGYSKPEGSAGYDGASGYGASAKRGAEESPSRGSKMEASAKCGAEADPSCGAGSSCDSSGLKAIAYGEFVLDPETFTVRRGNEAVSLPPKEFDLLSKFMANPGETLVWGRLMDDVCGWDLDSTRKTVRVHVSKLRARLALWDDLEIQTVRGVGYKLEVKK